MASIYFRNPNVAPQGGFFYELNGEKVTGRYFCDIEPKVRALLRKYRLTLSAEEAVAEYMCPRIPEASWMCTGGFTKAKIQPSEALKNSKLISEGRDVVPFDEIERRLRTCMACPMHTREFCVTCTGHMERILLYYGGRRQKVPEDAGSGICRACKAYESAVASIEYRKDEAVWEGVPDTCWRKTR